MIETISNIINLMSKPVMLLVLLAFITGNAIRSKMK